MLSSCHLVKLAYTSLSGSVSAINEQVQRGWLQKSEVARVNRSLGPTRWMSRHPRVAAASPDRRLPGPFCGPRSAGLRRAWKTMDALSAAS